MQMNSIDQRIAKRKRSKYVVILKRSLMAQDMKRMVIYSARKIKMNGTELNSVLKPLTNSDSPSEKSKGVRLVSARAETKKNSISTDSHKHKLLIFSIIIL